jgi:hypothetical protein
MSKGSRVPTLPLGVGRDSDMALFSAVLHGVRASQSGFLR